jgi:hypothetical protein
VKYYLLLSDDSILALQGCSLTDRNNFKFGVESTFPLSKFHIVDEELKVFVCMLNDDASMGTILSRFTLPEDRALAIKDAMQRAEGST